MKNDPRSCERNFVRNYVRSLKKIQDFNGIWTRDLAIPVRRSNQLSYKAIDVVGGQAILEWKRMFFQLFCDFNLISNSF